MEAEIGAQPQTKEPLEPPEAGRSSYHDMRKPKPHEEPMCRFLPDGPEIPVDKS
jgi:hypothetical protein